MASPAEVVNTLVRSPMIPLEGILNSKLIRSPVFSIDTISPLRRVTMSIILLEYSWATFDSQLLNRFALLPSMDFYKVPEAVPAQFINPSRRMVSINTDK